MIEPRDDTPSATSGIGLCLGASFLGFYAHAGFVRGLHAAGIRPDHIAGCSAGGIVGGLLAAGIPPEEVPGRLLAMRFVRTFFEFGIPLRGMAMLVNWPRVTGLLSGKRLLRFLRDAVGERSIESLTSPRLSLAATDLTIGNAVILQRGPLAESMLASAAVPVLFNAAAIGGRHYWDGGVANCLPVAALCADPAIHTIIVHRIVHGNESRAFGSTKAPSIASACNAAHQTVGRRMFELEEAQILASGRRLIHCETATPGPPLGRRRRAEQVKGGAATAEAHADDWRALLLAADADALRS